MAKKNKHLSNVQIRKMTPEQSDIVKAAMKLTGEKTASQALLAAAAELPRAREANEQLSGVVTDLQAQNRILRDGITEMVDYQDRGSQLQKDMRKLIKEIRETISPMQTRIT